MRVYLFFFLFSSIRNVLWDRPKANVSRMFPIHHIPVLKLLYFMRNNDAKQQRDRQEQICTIQSQVTTLQMAFT